MADYSRDRDIPSLDVERPRVWVDGRFVPVDDTFHDKQRTPDTIQHDNDLECERHFMLTLWAHGVTKVVAEDILTSLKQAHVRLVRT